MAISGCEILHQGRRLNEVHSDQYRWRITARHERGGDSLATDPIARIATWYDLDSRAIATKQAFPSHSIPDHSEEFLSSNQKSARVPQGCQINVSSAMLEARGA